MDAAGERSVLLIKMSSCCAKNVRVHVSSLGVWDLAWFICRWRARGKWDELQRLSSCYKPVYVVEFGIWDLRGLGIASSIFCEKWSFVFMYACVVFVRTINLRSIRSGASFEESSLVRLKERVVVAHRDLRFPMEGTIRWSSPVEDIPLGHGRRSSATTSARVWCLPLSSGKSQDVTMEGCRCAFDVTCKKVGKTHRFVWRVDLFCYFLVVKQWIC